MQIKQKQNKTKKKRKEKKGTKAIKGDAIHKPCCEYSTITCQKYRSRLITPLINHFVAKTRIILRYIESCQERERLTRYWSVHGPGELGRSTLVYLQRSSATSAAQIQEEMKCFLLSRPQFLLPFHFRSQFFFF